MSEAPQRVDGAKGLEVDRRDALDLRVHAEALEARRLRSRLRAAGQPPARVDIPRSRSLP